MLSRRRILGRLAGGAGMLGLAGLLQPRIASAANPALNLEPNTPPRAKRVIFLFLNGGPSQIDLFDHKPKAARPSPFAFKKHGESGLELSEVLPSLGNHADDLCVIRSVHTDIPNHAPAMMQLHTGATRPSRPSIGAWTCYGLGSENSNLPGYVVLQPGNGLLGAGSALWSSGFLPARYQGTEVITRELEVEKLLQNLRNSNYGLGEQREQLDLLDALNREHLLQKPGDAQLEDEIRAMELAYRMQIEATDAFDLSGESAATRERYGDSRFAQSCLLARRLAERGVRFTTVYHTDGATTAPWDAHRDSDKVHKSLGTILDRATSALIADLKQRGMFEDTVILVGGEFGRTPAAQGTGRNHHADCFSMLLAGGGVRGGTTYGTTDERGRKIVEKPVSTHDLHATILHLLGIDHQQLTYHLAGRLFKLTDEVGKVVQGVVA